jgi:hypothetical protein
MLKSLYDLNLKGEIKAKTDSIPRNKKEKTKTIDLRLSSNLIKV